METRIDVELVLSNMISGKEIYNIIKDMQTNRVKEFFETLNELLRKDMKVVCLTESRHNNPLWNHYGNGHEGICIQYNTDKFSSTLMDNCFPIFITIHIFQTKCLLKTLKN